MIINRKHLLLERVVSDDGMLQLNRDGSAVATNKKVFMAVEGVGYKERVNVPLKGEELGMEAVSMSDGTAREILKNVPRDKLFRGILEHLDVTVEGEGDFTAETTDGRRSRTIHCRAAGRRMDPKPMVSRILGVLDRGTVLCLNRKRLLLLLEAMERVAEDATEESPVWIGLGEGGDVALRCLDWATGRSVLGYMSAYREEGARQPPATFWEQSMWTGAKHKPRRRRSRNAQTTEG